MHAKKPEKSQCIVYTVGHSNMNIYDFFRILLEHHIELVIDVRSIPYSKAVPQFNKRNLEESLTENGFDYRYGGKHLGAYPGGKRPPPHVKPDWAKLATRPLFKQGIRRVLELAAMQCTVLMCAEENPYICHRHHLITPALITAGARVIHIRRYLPPQEVVRPVTGKFVNPDLPELT